MSKVLNKAKSGVKLISNMTRIRTITRQLSAVEAQRDQYYTERQILFDQSQNMRVFLANKYLSGMGIEIGPANLPLEVPHWVSVKYVDVMSEQELYKLYPGLKKHKLVHIDIVDDGETLSKVKDRSLDFVIANHFLEHTIDPIKTLKNFFRVLKKDGVLYMAVPDKAYTFDFLRPLTPLERLIEFHNNEAAIDDGKYAMYLEAAKYLEDVPKGKITARANEMKETNYSIHFNVWRQHDIIDLIQHCIKVHNLTFDYETVMKNQHELIVVLRKDPSDIAAARRERLEVARKAIKKSRAKSKRLPSKRR